MSVLGIDVGATYIKSGIVGEKGKVKNFARVRNNSCQGEEFFINQISEIIEEHKENFQIEKIGVGFAGPVNHERGMIIFGPNMADINDLPLKKILERKYELPVGVDNDGHCFALAENKFGAGKNYQNFVALTLGTGIGSGLILEKKLYRGSTNTAGEIGHMVIDKNSEARCGCGAYGHLEALASGYALARLYRATTEQDVEPELISEMAGKGEKLAQRCIIQIGYNFAIGLANIINIFNPEIVIVGGSLINIDLLWNVALNNVANNLLHGNLKKTKIVKSKLGNEAVVMGAAMLVM